MKASLRMGVLALLILLNAPSIWAGQEPKGVQTKPTIVMDVVMIDVLSDEAVDVGALAANQSKLRQAISEGKARVSASAELRAVSGDTAGLRSSMRLPIVTGQQKSSSGEGIDIVQYEDASLHITLAPAVDSDGLVDVKFDLEFSGLVSEARTQHPTYLNRTFSDRAKLRPGETAVVLGLSEVPFPIAQGKSIQPGSNYFLLLTARVLK